MTAETKSEKIVAIEEQYQLATYKKMPVVAGAARVSGFLPATASATWISTAVTRSPGPGIAIRTW